MKIAIVGYMASGKSLVGKRLAEDLGVPFVDLDQEIEQATGQTLSELLPIKNGLHFRKIEREVLLRILEQPKFFFHVIDIFEDHTHFLSKNILIFSTLTLIKFSMVLKFCSTVKSQTIHFRP